MGLQLTSRTISSFANSFRIRQRVRTSENGCERNEASRQHRHVARKGNFVTQLSKFDLELTSRTFSSFSTVMRSIFATKLRGAGTTFQL